MFKFFAMNNLLYIVWNPPIKLGFIRYYALLWIVGLVIAFFVVQKLYKEQKIKDSVF